MPEVRRRDEGAEFDPRGCRRGRGQCGYGPEPGAIHERSPTKVVKGPGVVEAVLFRGTPFGFGVAPTIFGENDDSCSHWRCSLSTLGEWVGSVQSQDSAGRAMSAP